MLKYQFVKPRVNVWNQSNKKQTTKQQQQKQTFTYTLYSTCRLSNMTIIDMSLMGSSGLKILKTCFKDNSWPRKSTQWANVLVGFWDPRPVGACVVITSKLALKNQNLKISRMAQMVERLLVLAKQVVTGSIPGVPQSPHVGSTNEA